MSKQKVSSFLVGLGISGFISLIVYYFLYTETIDLFGVESIIDPEGHDSIIFYTTLILATATLGVTLISLLSGNRTQAIGISLPSIIGIIILLKTGVVFFNKSNYYQDFNQKDWFAGNNKIKMARKLIKDKELIGWTKEHLIQKLGHGEMKNYNGQEFYFYNLEGDSINLRLAFSEDKVSSVRIEVDGIHNLI